MSAIQEARLGGAGTKQGSPKVPFYRVLWVQVLLAMIAAWRWNYWRPERFAYQCDLLDDRDHSCGRDGVGQA
ncbi:MAG TPA: hypothetical protein VEU94_17035 [Terriglobales bacterium]|nr:hypothetical protein [Terriglobales bacterium]